MHRTYSFDPVDLVRNWVGPHLADEAAEQALARTHGTDDHRVKQAALELLLARQAECEEVEREQLARKIRRLQAELGEEPVALVGDRRRPVAVDEYVG